jgi:hypothetical protein
MIQPLPKPQRERDEAYLDYIRARECVGLYLLSAADFAQHVEVCDFVQHHRSEANHIRHGVQTGMRTKPKDRRTLPFCTTLHREYTRLNHVGFVRKYQLADEIFERELKRLESGYRPAKVLRARTIEPKASVLVRIVRCVCGQTHALPIEKTQVTVQQVTFTCPVRNTSLTVARRGHVV